MEENNGLIYHYLNDAALDDRGKAIVQGVFTRQGGVSREPWRSLNVGYSVGDDPRAVEVNHQRICRALDIQRGAIATAQQVHGAKVARVRLNDCGNTFAATDGLVTDVPGVVLMLRFADCVPLLFFDLQKPAVGLAHAGWRGTLAGMATRMVEMMQTAFGSCSEELIVGIGPAIGSCCYQVGWELADRVQKQFHQWPDLIRHPSDQNARPDKGTFYFDLWLANRRQLEASGVRSVVVAQHCTACHTDEFFSHRATQLGDRVGTKHTGRFAALAGLRE